MSLCFLELFCLMLFDVIPIPFPPAFTIMVFSQIMFGLNIWWVIGVGVAGSILGRYILTLYIPFLAGKIFKQSKNEDVEFLGKKMKDKGWKSQLLIVSYSLLPLPTTPLFLAGGMAKIKPLYIIPAFFIGKFTSDAITVHLGKYAAENFSNVIDNVFSLKSIGSFVFGILLICCVIFIDWRTLIQNKKFHLNFRVWN